MIHTYSIQGLTCGNCVAKVRTALQSIPGITNADVTQNPPLAIVTMSAHVNTSVLAKTVANAGNFSLSENGHSIPRVIASDPQQVEATSFKPIYLLFAYIAGAATLVQVARGGFDPMHWMGAFMAAFFLTFSFFKMLDVRGFAEGYATYDVIAKRIPAYGLIYPFIELGLGISYVVAPLSPITNAVTLVVMGVSSIGVVQQVMRNSPFQCACLGTIFKLPLSKVTLVEDLLMVAMSAAMTVLGTHST
ncbi:MAG: cation transporter [Flavobacteriales bacterium]|nr:cation transporter [Flavobacteriales bacterium]